MLRHLRLSVFLLGQQLVVGVAHETDVLDGVLAAPTEGLAMVVEVEPVAGRAASAVVVLIGAAAPIALVHGAPDGRRDVT